MKTITFGWTGEQGDKCETCGVDLSGEVCYSTGETPMFCTSTCAQEHADKYPKDYRVVREVCGNCGEQDGYHESGCVNEPEDDEEGE